MKIENGVFEDLFARGEYTKREVQVLGWVILNSWAIRDRHTRHQLQYIEAPHCNSFVARQLGVPYNQVSKVFRDLRKRGVFVLNGDNCIGIDRRKVAQIARGENQILIRGDQVGSDGRRRMRKTLDRRT